MNGNAYDDKITLLKSAIKSEIEGYTFYDLLAKEISNADAKRRLESLRDDEHHTLNCKFKELLS